MISRRAHISLITRWLRPCVYHIRQTRIVTISMSSINNLLTCVSGTPRGDVWFSYNDLNGIQFTRGFIKLYLVTTETQVAPFENESEQRYFCLHYCNLGFLILEHDIAIMKQVVMLILAWKKRCINGTVAILLNALPNPVEYWMKMWVYVIFQRKILLVMLH